MAISVGQPAPEFSLKDQSQAGSEDRGFPREEECGADVLSARLEPGVHERARLHGERDEKV